MSARSQPTTSGHLSERGRVRFEFLLPTAKRVCVAGAFNGWSATATSLAPSENGRWLRDLWLPVGCHEYLFVVDGEWMFDPRATDYVPNVFGGMNAVAEVRALIHPQTRIAETPSIARRRTRSAERSRMQVESLA